MTVEPMPTNNEPIEDERLKSAGSRMLGGLSETDYVLWTMSRDLADLVKIIGKESDDGEGGTGLVGQIKNLVKARERSDRWINVISGGLAVMAGALGIIWWLVRVKLDAIFH